MIETLNSYVMSAITAPERGDVPVRRLDWAAGGTLRGGTIRERGDSVGNESTGPPRPYADPPTHLLFVPV